MGYKFSESMQINGSGFLHTDVTPEEQIPSDALDITDEQHGIMLSEKNEGKWHTVEGEEVVSHDSTLYWLPDGSEHRTCYAMQTPPNGALLTKPEPPYDQLRKSAILEKWSMAEQLEALTEASEDPPRPDKMNRLLADIHKIKIQFPKPDDK